MLHYIYMIFVYSTFKDESNRVKLSCPWNQQQHASIMLETTNNRSKDITIWLFNIANWKIPRVNGGL